MACGSSQEEWTLDRMKRLASALLALCMLADALPVPVLAETTGMPAEGAIGAPISEPTAASHGGDHRRGGGWNRPTLLRGRQLIQRRRSQRLYRTPVPTDEVTGTPTPVPTEGTRPARPRLFLQTRRPARRRLCPRMKRRPRPCPFPRTRRPARPRPRPRMRRPARPTPVPTDEAAGTPAPVPTDESDRHARARAHGRGGGQNHCFLRGRCPGGLCRAAGNA